MPKVAEAMSPAEVAATVKAGVAGKYAVGGAPGLALVIHPTGACSWVLRTRIHGKSTDRRLGGYTAHAGTPGALTLKQARDASAAMRVEVAKGEDPVTKRRREKQAEQEAAEVRASQKTFEEVARLAHETKAAGFKNAKHSAQWITTLETYAFPTLGERPVGDIRAGDVADVLRPIWHEIPETASRVGQRIASVLRYAEAHGWTDRAPVKAALELLGPQRSGGDHHPALPIADMSRFMVALRAAEGAGARALEFAILTAARSGEVRGATWREVDLKTKLWTVPGARMKRGKPHAVPLSDAALALLKSMPRGEPDDLIFPSTQPGYEGAAISDMTLSAVVRRLHEADVAAGGAGFVDTHQLRDGEHPVATPHGIARSTFRDWCSENGVSREIAERALAHAVGDKTEAAYARSTLIEQRRPVMQAWAKFLG